MMMKALKNQKGDVVVEAAVIFPAAILMVMILLYLSIILFQKANLQAGLETALTYYKSTVTDMYVSAQKAAVYEAKDGTTSADGNIYNAASPINPYEELFGNVHKLNQKDFTDFFNSVAGNMLFSGEVEITFKYKNYVIYKELEASAVQTIQLPIDFSFIGLDNKYTITADAKIAVSDHDDMIRNTDYAVALLKKTKLGEAASNIADKVKELYEKFTKLLASK